MLGADLPQQVGNRAAAYVQVSRCRSDYEQCVSGSVGYLLLVRGQQGEGPVRVETQQALKGLAS